MSNDLNLTEPGRGGGGASWRHQDPPTHPPTASHCSPSPACLLTQTKHQWQIGAVVDVSTFSVLVLVWRRPVPDAPQQPRGHWRTTQRPVTVRASPTCARQHVFASLNPTVCGGS